MRASFASKSLREPSPLLLAAAAALLLCCLASVSGEYITTGETWRIHEACIKDDPQGIKEAIAKGGDIEGLEKGGQTPLMRAVLMNRVNSVRTLLELGADPHKVDELGFGLLHMASLRGRTEIAKMLLEHGGFDVNERLEDGFAPLHRLAFGDSPAHVEMATLLLESGADINLPTGPLESHDGQSFHVTQLVQEGATEMAALLKEYLKRAAVAAVEEVQAEGTHDEL